MPPEGKQRLPEHQRTERWVWRNLNGDDSFRCTRPQNACEQAGCGAARAGGDDDAVEWWHVERRELGAELVER
jgi:hypothetical protein